MTTPAIAIAYAKIDFFCIVFSIFPAWVGFIKRSEAGQHNAPRPLARARPEWGWRGGKERPFSRAALSLNLSRRCCKSGGFVASSDCERSPRALVNPRMALLPRKEVAPRTLCL